MSVTLCVCVWLVLFCLVFFSAQFLVTILNLVSRHFSFSELLSILFEVLEDLFVAGGFFCWTYQLNRKLVVGSSGSLSQEKK